MLRFDGFGESLHGRFGFGADAGVGQERQGELQGVGTGGAAECAENQTQISIAARALEQLTIAIGQFGVRMSVFIAGKTDQAAQGQPTNGFRCAPAVNAGQRILGCHIRPFCQRANRRFANARVRVSFGGFQHRKRLRVAAARQQRDQ